MEDRGASKVAILVPVFVSGILLPVLLGLAPHLAGDFAPTHRVQPRDKSLLAGGTVETEMLLEPFDPDTIHVVLQALHENPSIRIRLPYGGEFELNLKVSSVWTIDPEGNSTFLDSLDQVPSDGDWKAVLRGSTSEENGLGALVLTSAGLEGIFNLPGGISALTWGPSTADWSLRTARATDAVAEQLYVTLGGPLGTNDAGGSPALPGETFVSSTTGRSMRVLNGAHENPRADEAGVESTPPGEPPGTPMPGHSMRVSKHTWSPSENGQSRPIDPTNVIFYDNIYATVFSWGMLQNHGWIEGVCGGDEYLYIYDYRHGGTDHWQLQHDHYGKDDSVCIDDRYHARMFRSDIGDTHVPGFDYYAGVPAHWECWGHSYDCVNPQRGQDQLLSDISGDERVKQIWMWQLTDNKDCVTCDRWNGWIDMYRVTSSGPAGGYADPCGSTKPTLTGYSETVPWSTYQYKTQEWQCVSGGGGGGGGSPYLAAWDGEAFLTENNILPGGENRSTDVTDYFLPLSTPAREETSVRVQIQEFEGDHTYLDRVGMFAVDYDGTAELAVDSYGTVLSFMEPRSPLSSTDSNGNDVSELLSGRDDGLCVQAAEGYSVDLDFGTISDGPAKLIMNADALKTSIFVYLMTANGSWMLVDVKTPRVNWALEATDLSRFLNMTGGTLVLRLYWTASHKVDWVALDTTESVQIVLTELSLDAASHSVHGDVRDSLLALDRVYAETLPGEHITLTFRAGGGIELRRILFVSVGHILKAGG